jgi:predicted nucleic acid-binding Zn ribbon protein
MSAELLKECPNCKGLLKRLIGTGSGHIFKGSGFYHTDYKNKPTNSGSSKKDSESSDKGSKSSDSSG